MPRYLMNGVYLRDLLADRPFGSWSQLLEYTQLYYARYPALSVGHHPMLLPILEAPLFLLFGISVFAARLVPLASLLVAVALLYALLSRRYGPVAALSAAALFATSPMIVLFTRTVMAEMPAIALVLTSAYSLQRFGDTGRRSASLVCIASFTLSLYAKPQAILVAPALFASALALVPLTRLLKRDVLLGVGASAILAAPAVAVPLMLSPSNMSGVMAAVRVQSKSSFLSLVWAALEPQLAWPVLIVAAIGLLRATVQRDPRSLFFFLWIAAVTPALYFFGGVNAQRYTLYWVPAWCALAGASLTGWRTHAVPSLIAATLAVGLTMQLMEARTIGKQITQAQAYEEAAQFVLAADPGPTVLFSGDIDSGYFVFFVRKHDQARRLIVLRSDKFFTTSRMERPDFADKIQRPEEIYTVLHRFGTRYVVLEDRPSKSHVLEWLRQEVKSPRFRERRRIPIRSGAQGASLVVFELLDRTPPDPNTVLSIEMPVIGRSLTVALRDLLAQKLLR